MSNLIKILQDAGFSGEKLRTAWAIAMRESGGNPRAHNTNAGTGDNSYGLFQINMLGSLGPQRDAKFKQHVEGYTGPDSLLDPVVNARAMKYMSANGTNWGPWDIDSSGYAGGRQGAAGYQKWLKQFPGENGGGPDLATSTGTGNAADSNNKGGDTLSKAQLEARYGFAKEVITKNPELFALWKKATNAKTGYWTAEEFQSQLQNTKWYKQNADFTRKAWVAEQRGGADWKAQLDEAGMAIDRAATALGANIDPQTRATMARDYIYKGWGVAGREGMLEKALAAHISMNPDDSYLEGAAGNLQQQMMETARRNGLKFSNGYYESAARSVAMGATTAEDWLRQQREAAASQWPVWRDQILSGVDMEDLASGYKTIMSQAFEVDPSSIDLADPYLKQALTQIDEKGQPKPVGLWDFEQQLKNDPRWLKTKQATNDIASVGMDVLKSFGMVG